MLAQRVPVTKRGLAYKTRGGPCGRARSRIIPGGYARQWDRHSKTTIRRGDGKGGNRGGASKKAIVVPKGNGRKNN